MLSDAAILRTIAATFYTALPFIYAHCVTQKRKRQRLRTVTDLEPFRRHRAYFVAKHSHLCSLVNVCIYSKLDLQYDLVAIILLKPST